MVVASTLPLQIQNWRPFQVQKLAAIPTQLAFPRSELVFAEVQEQLQLDLNGDTGFEDFKAAAQTGNVVPMHARIFSDHLTPVLAYRCLVRQDDRSAPSFLFEAVNNGTQQVEVAAGQHRASGSSVICMHAFSVCHPHLSLAVAYRAATVMWEPSHQ